LQGRIAPFATRPAAVSDPRFLRREGRATAVRC